MPLIPPTPLYAKRPDMAPAMTERINMTRTKKDERVDIVPKPLVGRMKSKIFENTREEPLVKPAGGFFANMTRYTNRPLTRPTTEEYENLEAGLSEGLEPGEEDENEDVNRVEAEGKEVKGENDDEDKDTEVKAETGGEGEVGTGYFTRSSVAASMSNLLCPVLLQPSSSQPAFSPSTSDIKGRHAAQCSTITPATEPCYRFTPSNLGSHMQTLDAEQTQRMLPILSLEAHQAATYRLEETYWGSNPAVQEKVSELTKTVRSSAGEQSGLESAEDRFIREMLLSVPHSLLPSDQTIGNQTQETFSIVEDDACFSIMPVLLPPSASDTSILADQQSSKDITEQRRKQVSTQSGGTMIHCLPLECCIPIGVRQRMSSYSHQSLLMASTSVLDQLVPSPIGLQPHTTAQGSFNIPVYAISPTGIGSVFADSHFTSFDTEYFTYLRRQQEASGPAASSNALPTQSILPDTQSTLQPQIRTPLQLSQQIKVRSDIAVSMYRQPSQPISPLSRLPQQPHFTFLQTTSRDQITHQILQTPSPTPYPPSSTAMLPPPRPGIIRNAPSPLSLVSPTPSPFATFVTQILATSPFLGFSSNASIPIQIYLPKVLIPGNGIGPNGTKMGNYGCIETDALLLGHEDIGGRKLVLSKAILLPVGMWENVLRKVRSRRWSVMETYAYPADHLGNSKGKGRIDDATGGKSCHRAVYEKLVSAYALMTCETKRREEELTKRWRVSRGPMTSHDRGAVWEGWGIFVDKGIEMSSQERQGAVRNHGEAPVKSYDKGVGDGYGLNDDTEEAARRRREMQELMDEDEEMYD